MSIMKKARRYMRKADRLSSEFTGFLAESPLLAVGLTLAVGTMIRTLGGGEAEEVVKPSRRRRKS